MPELIFLKLKLRKENNDCKNIVKYTHDPTNKDSSEELLKAAVQSRNKYFTYISNELSDLSTPAKSY